MQSLEIDEHASEGVEVAHGRAVAYQRMSEQQLEFGMAVGALGAGAGSKRDKWTDFRETSEQSARRVSSSTINCLRSCSPSCFFHQRFVNWPIGAILTKRDDVP